MTDIRYKTYRLRYLLKFTPHIRPPLNDFLCLVLNILFYSLIRVNLKLLCRILFYLMLYIICFYVLILYLFIFEVQKMILRGLRCLTCSVLEYQLFSGHYFIAYVLYFTSKYVLGMIFMAMIRMSTTDTLLFYFSNGRRKG